MLELSDDLEAVALIQTAYGRRTQHAGSMALRTLKQLLALVDFRTVLNTTGLTPLNAIVHTGSVTLLKHVEATFSDLAMVRAYKLA